MRANKGVRVEYGGEGESDYPSALQLYPLPPTMDISLEEFEECAVERLRLLRVVENQNLSGRTKFSPEWVDAAAKEVEKAGLSRWVWLNIMHHYDIIFIKLLRLTE